MADELTRRIQTVEQWLQTQARSDARVQRLQTHPGVGLLTSLCLVHTLGDLSRFSSTRKVAAYVGFDPMDVGPLRIARYTEPFTLLIARIAYEGTAGPDVAYRFENFEEAS